jgi:hypothetical protein
MSIYFGEFQPHKVPNTGLYIQRKDSTVSLCPDYSSNGYDFAQGVAAQQPSLGINTINFDGSNDAMINNTPNVFSSDNSGYIFFSGYYNNAAFNRILTSSDTATNTRRFDININNATSKFGLVVNNGGGSVNAINFDTTTLTNGQYYHGWIRSNGSVYTGMLNGVSQTITTTLANDGRWWSYVTGRDNLVIGALISSVVAYGSAQINKVHYVSGTLSAIDLWKIEQFMSNPLNYI